MTLRGGRRRIHSSGVTPTSHEITLHRDVYCGVWHWNHQTTTPAGIRRECTGTDNSSPQFDCRLAEKLRGRLAASEFGAIIEECNAALVACVAYHHARLPPVQRLAQRDAYVRLVLSALTVACLTPVWLPSNSAVSPAGLSSDSTPESEALCAVGRMCIDMTVLAPSEHVDFLHGCAPPVMGCCVRGLSLACPCTSTVCMNDVLCRG